VENIVTNQKEEKLVDDINIKQKEDKDEEENPIESAIKAMKETLEKF
jgi:hypothetical protein